MIEYCKFCGKDIKDLKPTQKGNHVANCEMNPNIKIIKEKRKLSKNETQRLKNPLIKITLNCLNCDKEFENEVIESYYKRGRYKKCCCKKCAKKYSTINYNDELLKKDFCKKCGKDILVKNRTKNGISKCEDCKKIKKICKICGSYECKIPDICNKLRQKNNVYEKYLGFDSSKKGSNEIYAEFDRIVYNLKSDYFENELSMNEIANKYNMSYQTIFSTFKKIGIISRTISEAISNSIKNGKITYDNVVVYPYKSGNHITWKGDSVHYRSSYEKEYYSILDCKKINYEIESLRIKYYDTQKKKIRIAIPDIYIKDTNEIVEIKSKWTLNEVNMEDKIKSYKKLGYNVRLIIGEGNKNFFKNSNEKLY